MNLDFTKSVRQFLLQLNKNWSPLPPSSPEQARKAFTALQNSSKVDVSGITELQKIIPCDDTHILLNIVRPEGSKGPLPVFLFIPGGGWVLGDYSTHKRMVRDLVVATGFTAVFINYSRSPEARYPQALKEIHTAAKWLSEHGETIQVHPERIAIVGNGVGATMAAAVSLMAKANGGPEFKAQILICPAASAGFDTDSWKKHDAFLSTALMKWMWDQYTADLSHRKEIYASPLQATPEQLKGLPPTLIQTAENDILRDEGEAFGRALDNAGVMATTIRYNGVIHDFGLLNGLAGLPQTKSLFLHAAAELKNYLD
ncbi:MAG: alpha/beta hydrolase [Bacteroidetes bacterium]|nr:alpha/beta hydrolase [Bacteroidota bacterium]